MAEDILKRINEILKEGIKATGIDVDPTDTSKYGFAPEHSSLIRELEQLELLEELQELVGGEEELGKLITSIAKKQEEVSPRYQTQEFQNFNAEGEPIGKRAYGITTTELQQKEIQDVIKNFIDTPTNVVDNNRLLWGSEEFIDVILADMRASADLFDFDMGGDLEAIRKSQPKIAKQIEQGKINIANHIDAIELMKETLDRTDLPPGMSKYEASDMLLMLIESAQSKHRETNPDIPILGITDTQSQDPEFKKILTQQFADTPTNVVDDAPLLETRFNYGLGEIDEWADDVIKPNKVFNPDSFTRYTGEGEEYIWNRTTSFDAKELYERILKNRASDEDITKFFIYLASHSPSTAYAHKPYFQADALSDIVKIGIFSDKPVTEVIPMGVFRDEAFFLDRLQSRNSELGPEINKVLIDLVTEQGQFTNLKERMRNVIIDAHNEIYKNNSNDYFVLWRGGKLNRFYPWQSMSKSPSSAQAVSYQMNQLYGAGDTVETYLIHKNNMIDLDALGLSFSNEQEIIVLAEAANKPGAKLEQVLIQDDVDRINVSDLPKNGFEIDNITKPLADAGQTSQEFFDDVIKGINEKYRPKSAYEQIIDLNNPDIYKWQDDYNKLVKEGGNFNQHIFTSIPTFYETQIIKGLALSNLLDKQPMPDNLLKGRYQVLDIGGTEGTWAKALAKNNPNLYVEVLDPLQKARDVFEEGELVTNAIFRNEAFSYVLDDQDKIFDAKGIQPVRFAVFNEVDKYDVVHESMAFQFMDKNRAEQIKFIKENLLNENGIIIIEEKFANNDAIYKANEELKNTFKSKYYTPEQLQDKKFNVLLDMEANQVSVQEIEKILSENFANVQQYWDAGNFKGYIASDSDVVNQFVPEINNLEVSLTNHRFSTAPTEKEIKVAVQNKMQQGGTDSKLAAQLAQETVAKNPKLFNTLAKTLARFSVLGGTALAGLGKIAPALSPGDVAIEKAIEKAVPYLDDAASKLGFARLKFGNILPTYIAFEIGVALADVAQAALYADSSAYKYRKGGAVYNELRQPELDATGKPVKVLGMSAYDYFQTPPGKKQLEEFDFGSQFMRELDQEKISKYSPGWGLTKGLLTLLSTPSEKSDYNYLEKYQVSR